MKNRRYEYLDILRGITLISMIIYHTMWDLVYIARVKVDWYPSDGTYIWQQSICWTFILLAGFCWSLGRNKLKRGLIVFAAGLVITLVTCIFVPNQRAVFGVLTLLGSSMLLMISMEKILRKIPSVVGFTVSMLLFLLAKNINHGTMGIGEWVLAKLPESLYDCGYIMTFLGFMDRDFYSTDYFSLIPWMFLFVTGYFLYRMAEKKILEGPLLAKIKNKPLAFVGRHSLIIYMLHQPIIYFVIMCVL